MSEVDRPCPNCGHTLNGCSGLRSYGTYQTHDTAYCLRYLSDDLDALRAQLAAAEAQAQTAREDALREAADRSSLTVRSIKEALDKRDWDAAREIAMKGPPAILALIQPTEPRNDAAKEE